MGPFRLFWGIRREIQEKYNELLLEFQGGYDLIFRAYNDGVAYRWKTILKGNLTILGEESEFRFLENYNTIAHVVREISRLPMKSFTAG